MWQPQSFQPAQGSPQAWAPQSFQPSGNQPAGNTPAQGESTAPSNSDIGNNQQAATPMMKLNDYFIDQPNTTYGNILPFAKNDSTGETSMAWPEVVRSPMRGLAEMMAGTAGELPQGQNLSPDAIQALTMISPTSVANAGNMARVASETPAIGNKLIESVSNLPQNAMADTEDQSISQLMAANAAKNVQPQGSALMQGFGARDTEALQNASDENFRASSGIYGQMRQAGAVLNNSATDDLKSNIDDALSKNLFIPQLNPKTLGIVDHLKAAIDQDGTIPLDQLDQYRRLLSRVGASEDGVSAGMVKKAIDSTVNNLDGNDLQNGSTEAIDLLNKARASYAASSRFDDVAEVLQKANGDPNKIKQYMTKFMSDDDNTVGWTQAQKDAGNNAANTGIGENLLKALGKFGFDFSKSGTGNTVLPALAAMGKMGGAAIVPGGIPMVMAGTAARQAQKYLARGKAEQLLDALQNGVPK